MNQWAPNGQGQDPNMYQQPNMGQDANMYQQPNMGQDPNMYQQPNMGQDPNMYQQPNMGQDANPYQEPYVMGQNTMYQQEPQKKSKTGLVIGIVSVVIIALAVGAYFLLFSGGGYTKPMDDIASIVNTRNSSMDDIIDAALPSFASKPIKSAYSVLGKSSAYQGRLSQANSQLAQAYTSLENQFGSDFRISYKVTDKTSLSSSECSTIAGQYQALYTQYLSFAVAGLQMATDEQLDQAAAQIGLSGSDLKPLIDDISAFADELKEAEVSEGYKLNVDLTATSNKMTDDTINVQFTMIKLNGEWMIDYLSIATDNGIDLNGLTGLMN